MTEPIEDPVADLERRLAGLLASFARANPTLVAQCRPGIDVRPVTVSGWLEAYLTDEDGNPVVIGRFPARWLRDRPPP